MVEREGKEGVGEAAEMAGMDELETEGEAVDGAEPANDTDEVEVNDEIKDDTEDAAGATD